MMRRWITRQEHSLRGRLILSALALIAMLTLYHSVNALMAPRIEWLYIDAIDARIPFFPWTLPIYMSLYLELLVAALLVPGARYTRALKALLIATITGCAGFILLPAHYPRPDPSTIDSALWRAAFTQLHAGDGAGNTFPSLHVATATLLAITLRSHRLKWLMFAWSALIAISTLTVKQHFALDVVGGVLVALFAYAITTEGPKTSNT